MKNQQLGEIALLSAYLDDQKFDQLAQDEKFQDYVLSQKTNILNLLDKGYQLSSKTITTQTVKSESVKSEPVVKMEALKLDIRPTATASMTAPKDLGFIEISVVEDVLAAVKKICSEKTGYPEDFLESELDLEGDLGIDTIKQMEIMAAVREKFNIPKKEGFALKQVPTLKSIESFVRAEIG